MKILFSIQLNFLHNRGQDYQNRRYFEVLSIFLLFVTSSYSIYKKSYLNRFYFLLTSQLAIGISVIYEIPF